MDQSNLCLVHQENVSSERLQPLCTQKDVHRNSSTLKSRANETLRSDPMAHVQCLMPCFSPRALQASHTCIRTGRRLERASGWCSGSGRRFRWPWTAARVSQPLSHWFPLPVPPRRPAVAPPVLPESGRARWLPPISASRPVAHPAATTTSY